MTARSTPARSRRSSSANWHDTEISPEIVPNSCCPAWLECGAGRAHRRPAAINTLPMCQAARATRGRR